MRAIRTAGRFVPKYLEDRTSVLESRCEKIWEDPWAKKLWTAKVCLCYLTLRIEFCAICSKFKANRSRKSKRRDTTIFTGKEGTILEQIIADWGKSNVPSYLDWYFRSPKNLWQSPSIANKNILGWEWEDLTTCSHVLRPIIKWVRGRITKWISDFILEKICLRNDGQFLVLHWTWKQSRLKTLSNERLARSLLVILGNFTEPDVGKSLVDNLEKKLSVIVFGKRTSAFSSSRA